jgi:hypothetical protein
VTKAIVPRSEESAARIQHAIDTIMQAFDGCTKEELAATLCAVAAAGGFYDEALRFATIAKERRDAFVRAGGPDAFVHVGDGGRVPKHPLRDDAPTATTGGEDKA